MGLMLGTGCAYFNTFYNAKQYYKKGYAETKKNLTGKPGATEKKHYEEAITRALTLIVDYPKSKYVDDALLLAGKAYYYREEYFMAKRKFLELITNYPESPFVNEAKLWMARTNFALDEFDEAETLVNTLVSDDVEKRIKGQAYYYLGKFHERKRHFDQATEAYRSALNYGLEDQQANTYFSLGNSLDTLGRYEEARDAFGKVQKATYLKELRFEARFRYAQMNKKLGNVRDALSDFQMLMADEENAKRVPEIKLQIADTYFRGGDADAAVDAYDEITQVHEKTKESTQAFYQIGRIFETHYSDYEKALDNYVQAKKSGMRSVYADTAELYSRDIQRLQALHQVVDLGKRGETGEALLVMENELDEDTLTLDLAYDMMDTTTGDTACYHLLTEIGGKQFADSVFVEKNKSLDQRERDIELNMGLEKEVLVDWREWVEEHTVPSYSDMEAEFPRLQARKKLLERPKMADNPELSTFRVEELDRNLFLLAELYLFRFQKPDSAFNYYDYLVREFPESPYAAKSLYNMAHLYETHYKNPEQVELIYRSLMDEYKSTPYANAARQKLGENPVPSKNDTIANLFASAEDALFTENEPAKALDFYEHIRNAYSDTDFAPKALYAQGYVYEHYMDLPDLAYATYDSLIKWYPESPYSQRVQPKIEAVKGEEIQRAKARETATVQDSMGGKGVMPGLAETDSTVDQSFAFADGSDEDEDPENPVQRTRSSLRRGDESALLSVPLDLMARRRRELRLIQGQTAPR